MGFSKGKYFKVCLKDFLEYYPEVSEEDAVAALKELKRKHVAAVGSDIMTSHIGATNLGWKAMGWVDQGVSWCRH